jgi:TetR/AcrR family transcriptional regulator, mexJK operon transcriptional repressor
MIKTSLRRSDAQGLNILAETFNAKEGPRGNSGDRSEAIRTRIVAAAREEFFRKGYGDTSMSAIAAMIGGSKTTLWAYYDSKQKLFAAVADDLIANNGQLLAQSLDPTLALEDTLTYYGRSMLDIVTSRPMLELHRLVIAEAARFPELGELLFERSFKQGQGRLAVYLGVAMKRNEVKLGDPECMASQFDSMCRSRAYVERLYGKFTQCDASSIAADVAEAVATALAAWRA